MIFTMILASLQLLVTSLDVLHNCLAFLQLLELNSVLLVLIEVGSLPHHSIGTLQDLLQIGHAGLSVLDESCTSVVAVEIVAIIDGSDVGLD
jgi:hypothetical protein